jgi:acid phosphatase
MRYSMIKWTLFPLMGVCMTPVFAQTQSRQQLQSNVKNIVVIYAENRSFDSLYGDFPGAHGLSDVLDAKGKPKPAYIPQKDRDGVTVLKTLPPTWGGVTAPGSPVTVTQAQSQGLANEPFAVADAFGVHLNNQTVTRDLYHRFFEHQMQIHGGKNDLFAAWSDAGGLTMGHYQTRDSAVYRLAQQYVLADHFFQGAFGGSFLNHQYLVCACAPEYPHADQSPAKGSITQLKKDRLGKWLPELVPADDMKASALEGAPRFARSSNLTPANYFGDDKFYAINTMQPPYQPSGNQPPSPSDALANGDALFFADPSQSTTLPAQTAKTVADALDAKAVSWKWYSGSWRVAQADGRQAAGVQRSVIYTGNANGVATAQQVDFQAHHQPFNYYAQFDPVSHADYRQNHLQDYEQLLLDADAGQLPAVAFYKPEGVYTQHPGYANVQDGDQRIAEVVSRLQKSPQWKNMVIVITYDEFGGTWDHMPPPKGDLLGPGTRIPAIIVSPFARKGTVDHTPYDTGSIMRLISHTFDVPLLPGVVQRDEALKSNGLPPMGDLTQALQF